MAKPRILFITTFHYLCLPVFKALSTELGVEFERVLFEPGEESFDRVNGHGLEQVIEFDRTVSLFGYGTPGPGLAERFIDGRGRAARIRKKIRDLKPDLVVTAADGSLAVKILDRHFPSIPVVVIQTALLDFSEARYWRARPRPMWKSWLLKLLLPAIYPIYTENVPFGRLNPRHYLFVFGPITSDFYSGKRPRVYEVGFNGIEIPTSDTRGERKILLLGEIADNLSLQNQYYNDLFDLMALVPGRRWILRPHPRADRTLLEKQLSDPRFSDVEYVPDGPVDELFVRASLCISACSFADFQFIANDVPVIHFRDEPYPSHTYWFQNSGIPFFRNIVALGEALGRLNLADLLAEEKKYLNRMFIAFGRESSRRMAQEIRAILRQT